MLRKWAKLILLGSAIAPVGLTYAYVAYLQGHLFGSVIACIISFFAIFLAWLFVKIPSNKLSSSELKIVSIETADSENLSFMLLYILPLFENDISSLNWPVTIPAATLFAWVIWSGYGYHFNPVLSFFGWHYFKASTPEGITYILISKQSFCSGKQTLRINQLTEYIVLDLGAKS